MSHFAKISYESASRVAAAGFIMRIFIYQAHMVDNKQLAKNEIEQL